MMKGAKGTKMPRGDKNQILDFEIPNFPIDYQQKIANILTDIDNKIALNNKLNDNLFYKITPLLPVRSSA
ncbi:Type I restriction modification DNA specificity domain-containing protein [Epilithonimonas bovis DSM 19482]|uniref:Type I restriction modification DNA specificity domain-containing protein n=2 Tax=Epilithonimonas TaxID=2782229 RepID=A0A1U7PYY4_9FLAO|nr:Type I restriction modification DNA specificity domain-containing protein [Epilithonimonas bovis DSM 19482]